MVVRVAKKDKNKERRFYGCANFPQCREGLPYSPDEG
jgi:ssDNA-binding Zn-finger/Zn-ribbon topoisomerase 1